MELNSCHKLDFALHGRRQHGAAQPQTLWTHPSQCLVSKSLDDHGNMASRHWVCGSLLTTTSRNSWQSREVSAWRLFCSVRLLLCNDRVALRHRLRLFSSCVVSFLYWCAGSWILTRSQCTHCWAPQDKMLRIMIHVPRRPMEHDDSHRTAVRNSISCMVTRRSLPVNFMVRTCFPNGCDRFDTGDPSLVRGGGIKLWLSAWALNVQRAQDRVAWR